MKSIRIKTQQEREKEKQAKVKEVMVKSRGYYYYVCEKCRTAFFDSDMILESSTGAHFCPLNTKRWWRVRPCLAQIFGGDEEDFKKYYEIKET